MMQQNWLQIRSDLLFSYSSASSATPPPELPPFFILTFLLLRRGGGVKNGTLGSLEIVKSSSCQCHRWPWWLQGTKKRC